MFLWIGRILLALMFVFAIGTPIMGERYDEAVPITDAQTESRVVPSPDGGGDGCHTHTFHKCCRSCR